MEKLKGYTFNTGKEKTAIMIFNKKKNNLYELDLEVKKGKIEITQEYKYLGEWYNENCTHETSIKKRKEKIQTYIKIIKLYGNEFKIGKYTMTTRLKIYKTIVRPAVFHNIEGWSKINKKEINELENIQATILKKICEMRMTTSYFGLLSETGIWRIQEYLDYKKIILFHNIVTSKNNRVLKDVIEDELVYTWKGCWVQSIKEICLKYKIDIEKLKELSKQNLKIKMRKEITNYLNEILKQQYQEKTKMRFIKEFAEKSYLKKFDF